MMRFIKKIVVRLIVINVIGMGLLTAVSAANPNESAPKSIRRFIIFGDSLSDNGNLFSLTIQIHKIKEEIPVIPNPLLYWNGRFSNGPVWNEYLANMVNFIPETIDPTLRKTNQYINYAYVGSWAEKEDNDSTVTINQKQHSFPPPLPQQIDQYTSIIKAAHPLDYQKTAAQDLIFIWTGANDYLNHNKIGPVARSPEISTQAVIASIQANILKLIEVGNKNFVVFNMPDLSRVPDIVLKDPLQQNLAPMYATTSALHNQKLADLIDELQKRYPALHFTYVPIDKIFEKQFKQAHLRQQEYSQSHQGKFQNEQYPCLYSETDPTPTVPRLLQNNFVLASAIGPAYNEQTMKSYLLSYPTCDLRRMGDQLSPFTYDQYYRAGGIFFDHLHPTTHIHAILALHVCRLLETQQYSFYQEKQGQYLPVICSQHNVNQLTQNIVNPSFPMSEQTFVG